MEQEKGEPIWITPPPKKKKCSAKVATNLTLLIEKLVKLQQNVVDERMQLGKASNHPFLIG